MKKKKEVLIEDVISPSGKYKYSDEPFVGSKEYHLECRHLKTGKVWNNVIYTKNKDEGDSILNFWN